MTRDFQKLVARRARQWKAFKDLRPLVVMVAAIIATTFMGHRAIAAGKNMCQDVPRGVVELSYGSRYGAASKTKSAVDAKKDAAVSRSLKPVDDFIRNLAREANSSSKLAGHPQHSSCAIRMLLRWAVDDSLSVLSSRNAEMTIGARLAGIILSYSQVSQHASQEEQSVINGWIRRRLNEQVTYWDYEAPRNARRGNLKAWAALAVLAGSIELRDQALMRWSYDSTVKMLCTVDSDGALPREMERGSRALHYQIHSLAPLVSSVALFERQGIDVKDTCDNAIERAVWYVVRDLESLGTLSKEKSGSKQSYFTGRDRLKSYQFAFGVSYLSFSDDAEFAYWLRKFGSLNYSKLGGDQQLIW